MKVTLDLDALLASGEIDRAEYDKLSRLAARGTASLAFNLLIGFGVIAVVGAALALVPAPPTAIVLGLAAGGAGLGLRFAGRDHWQLLAQICIAVGALLFAGGVVVLADGASTSFLLVALVCAMAGVSARNALLTVIAVLALASALGSRTGYLHASYFLGVEAPSLTILVFSLLGIAAYWLARRVPAAYGGVAAAAARTSALLVNLGFWVGSLWGDRWRWGGTEEAVAVVPDWVFALAWAVVLAAAGAWAWRRNLRWVVNVVAVFGAIHFYTQWFERLGASPASVLIAGLLALLLGLGMKWANERLAGAHPSAPPSVPH